MPTTVIYHRADFDGLFSAAVCMKFLPGAEMIGWDFGDPLIPFPGEGTLYIVDLSPDCLSDAMVAVAAHHDRLVWIDHHKSSIDKWNPSISGYRIDGVAACRLCWQWFESGLSESPDLMANLDDYAMRRVEEPLALTLAGEYDVWALHDKRSLPFQFGLTALAKEGLEWLKPFLEVHTTYRQQPGDVLTEQVADDGEFAMKWQRAFASQIMRERSYVREWECRTFCVLASCHARNSMWFPQEAIPKECDALMCWRYDGERVSFSLYHAPGHEEHDLSQIAVKYGGGGHRGACGFSMSLDDALNITR